MTALVVNATRYVETSNYTTERGRERERERESAKRKEVDR
jgi:hypothetical protein